MIWLVAALLACWDAPSDPLDTAESVEIVDTDVPDSVDTDAVTAPFVLTSPAFTDVLPVDYTCDGAGHSPPLAWSGVPDGAVELAVMATTMARDGEKWNWVLFGLPAGTTGLEVDTTLGTAGLTSDGPNLAWSPPCSQGPGAKVYTFTVYALSAAPELPASPRDVTGPVLTAAIAEITLGEAALSVSYTR